MCYKSNLDYVNQKLIEHNEKPLTGGEISDFGITEHNTISELDELVSDYLNEVQTVKSENKNAWRYEV